MYPPPPKKKNKCELLTLQLAQFGRHPTVHIADEKRATHDRGLGLPAFPPLRSSSLVGTEMKKLQKWNNLGMEGGGAATPRTNHSFVGDRLAGGGGNLELRTRWVSSSSRSAVAACGVDHSRSTTELRLGQPDSVTSTPIPLSLSLSLSLNAADLPPCAWSRFLLFRRRRPVTALACTQTQPMQTWMARVPRYAVRKRAVNKCGRRLREVVKTPRANPTEHFPVKGIISFPNDVPWNNYLLIWFIYVDESLGYGMFKCIAHLFKNILWNRFELLSNLESPYTHRRNFSLSFKNSASSWSSQLQGLD